METVQDKPRTWAEACQEVADWLRDGTDGVIAITGEDIFNVSPTGELWPVAEMIDICKVAKEKGIPAAYWLEHGKWLNGMVGRILRAKYPETWAKLTGN